MKVRVNTDTYKFSHGKDPKGYGCWWFQVGPHEVTFAGTYTEAKQQAVRFAEENEHWEVDVKP